MPKIMVKLTDGREIAICLTRSDVSLVERHLEKEGITWQQFVDHALDEYLIGKVPAIEGWRSIH